jgi:hypothetical protein
MALNSMVLCQCPAPGLKVISPICDTPRNLRASDIKCTTVKLNWEGNKNQKYIVNTADSLGESDISTADSSHYSCDNSGKCATVIPVKQGTKLNWNVQAICSIDGTIIYSPKIDGEPVSIPDCSPISANDKKENNDKAIKVFPNPTTGYLNVEYDSKIFDIIQFTVFDMSGKKVFSQSSSNLLRTNNLFQLDLHNLSSAMYLLEVRNGSEISRIKFVLARD